MQGEDEKLPNITHDSCNQSLVIEEKIGNIAILRVK